MRAAQRTCGSVCVCVCVCVRTYVLRRERRWWGGVGHVGLSTRTEKHVQFDAPLHGCKPYTLLALVARHAIRSLMQGKHQKHKNTRTRPCRTSTLARLGGPRTFERMDEYRARSLSSSDAWCWISTSIVAINTQTGIWSSPNAHANELGKE